MIFPIEPKGRRKGVGFRLPNGHEYYFRTPRGSEVLEALETWGYPVTSEPLPATKIWKGIP